MPMKMRICNYKQFNESYDLELNTDDRNKIEEKVYRRINSMDETQMNSIFNELEKMAHKLNCTVAELSNPAFVKSRLDHITSQSVIAEGFLDNMKERVFRFLGKVFEWGSAIGSIMMIVTNALNGNGLGIFSSAMALAISILASSYINTKINQKFK